MDEAEDNPFQSPLARGLPPGVDIPYWVKDRLSDLPDRPAAIRKLKRELLMGVLFFPIWFFALSQWGAIRWMDRHDRWEATPIPNARIRSWPVELAVVSTLLAPFVVIGILSIPACDNRSSRVNPVTPLSIEP